MSPTYSRTQIKKLYEVTLEKLGFGKVRMKNYIHVISLRIVYKDNVSYFEKSLNKDKTIYMHHRDIQSSTIELFKVKNIISLKEQCVILELEI